MHDAEAAFEGSQEKSESLRLMKRGVKILRHSLKAVDMINTRHATEFPNLETSWKKKLNQLAESFRSYQSGDQGREEADTKAKETSEHEYKFWCLDLPKRRHVRCETWVSFPPTYCCLYPYKEQGLTLYRGIHISRISYLAHGNSKPLHTSSLVFSSNNLILRGSNTIEGIAGIKNSF